MCAIPLFQSQAFFSFGLCTLTKQYNYGKKKVCKGEKSVLHLTRKGLGKDGQGQVDPVEIVILPMGKSLDVCAEMREAKKLRKPLGQAATRRKKKKRILGNGSHQQQQQV